MKINAYNAAKTFFPNPSLEYVYFEAIANSIDAGASHINIDIEIGSLVAIDTFKVTITDDGKGFRKRNFDKFSKLLEVEEEEHKGLGRLVYLNYFKSVLVTSEYENEKRIFDFTDDFEGESDVSIRENESVNSTSLYFTGYRKEKIKAYEYILPDTLKKSVIKHFFPKFYQMKIDSESLEIVFNIKVNESKPEYGFINSSSKIILRELPDLSEKSFTDSSLDFFTDFKILYSIGKTYEKEFIITAICADGRTISFDVLSNKAVPDHHNFIFILYSDFFKGKANTSRDALNLDRATLKRLKKVFTDKISEILDDEMPEIKQKNDEVRESLNTTYPHLQGYFDDEPVGLLDKSKTVELAQGKFFLAQKEILEATNLNDEQYEKSLEISSRLLTEYILYRSKIINKLKGMTPDNSEGEIHDIIIPRKKKFYNNDIIDQIFTNNAWVLDDKYMSFNTILSDMDMGSVYEELNVESDELNTAGRPDITIIFSNDPDKVDKVDVVIVELKKLGVGLAKKEEVVSQLRQRARRLAKYYPNKIQRVWFYGIIDFDEEFRDSLLEDDFVELFSLGDLYYKEQSIIADSSTKEKIPMGLFVLSYEALLEDAESRNETFLKLLSESLKMNKV